MVRRARHAAAVEEDLECGTEMTGAGFHVNAVLVAVEALREDHAVERPIELDVDAHVRFLALHLEVLYLRVVGGGAQGPRLVAMRTAGRASRSASRRTVHRRWRPIHASMF